MFARFATCNGSRFLDDTQVGATSILVIGGIVADTGVEDKEKLG